MINDKVFLLLCRLKHSYGRMKQVAKLFLSAQVRFYAWCLLFVNEAYLHKRDRELLKQKIHKSKYSLQFFIDFRLMFAIFATPMALYRLLADI